MTDFAPLEAAIQYSFRNPGLLMHAMTHSSYAAEQDENYTENNERLEFIGDAYLDAIIGNCLYDRMPDRPEGVLSQTRSYIVCEKSLAEISRSLNIGEYLNLGHGEELTGGRDKDSILADAMEALIGAVIIDSGFEPARRMVLRLFEEHIRLAMEGKLYHDYKSELQERMQEKYHSNFLKYELVSESGPAHDRRFEIQVMENGKALGRGTGKSKKEAEQQAAKSVLLKGEY